MQWSDSDSEGADPVPHQHHAPVRVEDSSDEGLGQESLQSSMSWLSQHVVQPYWEGRNQSHDLPDLVPSAHPSCHLAQKWAGYVIRSDPFQRAVEVMYLTEGQIVRETIW